MDNRTSVPIPGGGRFRSLSFQYASLHEGLVFAATYSGGRGLFIWDGSGVRPLILPGEVAQDGEVLTSAERPNGAGSLLSFSARTADSRFFEAIYVRTGTGHVKRVLRITDDFEGGQVGILSADADHNTLAIRLDTCDATACDDAIYRVAFVNPSDIPVLSPAGIAAFALLLTLAGLRGLRRRS